MDTGKFVGLLVFGLVGILVVVAFLPMIQETTSATDTFTNEGMWRMKEIENGDEWEFTSSPYGWEYNDVAQTSVSSSGSSALLGDDWTVRSNGQARGPYISGNATGLSATADSVNITFTGVQGQLTYPISGYGIKDDGAYLMTAYNKPVYVLGNSTIYATGVSGIDDVGCTIHIEGTVNDGVTITMMNNRNSSNISNAVFSNVVINAESVAGYVNLYELTSITADVTFDNTVDGVTTSHTGSITYSSYVVPYQITAEKTIHPDSALATMINLLPLIAVIGLFVFLVGEFLYTRYL